MFPDDIAMTIRDQSRRFSSSSVLPFSIGSFKKLVSSLPRVVAQQAVRSVLNGWCTSHRLHESVQLPALCGCHNEIDSLDHYIIC